MGTVASLFRQAFRDHRISGIPSTGPNEPNKAEVRLIGDAIESLLALSGVSRMIFPDAVSAIADTDEGQLFLIQGSGSNFAVLHKNVSGVAVNQGISLPSAQAVLDEASVRTMADETVAFTSTAWVTSREGLDKNLFDARAITNANLNGNTGNTFPSSVAFTTDHMGGRQGADVRFSMKTYNIAWYDKDRNYIDGQSSSDPDAPVVAAGEAISWPIGAFYLRAAFNVVDYTRSLTITQASDLPAVPKPFAWLGSRWHDANIALAGDSFEVATGAEWSPSYPPLIAEWLQAHLVHFPSDAVSGRTMMSLVPFLTSSNLAVVDLLHVKLGTNDHQAGVPLGSLSDAINLTGTGTFYGATAAVIQAVQQIASGSGREIRLAFSTPPKKGAYTVSPFNLLAWNQQNSQGLTLTAYADAVLEVCDYYAIPALDLFRRSGFNAFTFGTLTGPDKLHPSKARGVPSLARQIAGFLAGL